jgi:hypothetical protein
MPTHDLGVRARLLRHRPGSWRPAPLVALACALACAGTPATPAPGPVAAVTPEAPPATAVRLLLDHKDGLELSPKQRDKLQAIDRELEATNAPLEKKLHELESRPQPSSQTPQDRGGVAGGASGPRMGMGGGGRRGGGRGRSGGRAGRGAGPSASVAKRPHETETETVHAQMLHNHDAALARAFEVLDLEQRARARQLLEDSDFEQPPEALESAKDGPAAP